MIDMRELEKEGYSILYPPYKGVMARKGDIGINAKGEEVPMPYYESDDDDGSKPRDKVESKLTEGSKAKVVAEASDGAPKRGRKNGRRDKVANSERRKAGNAGKEKNDDVVSDAAGDGQTGA